MASIYKDKQGKWVSQVTIGYDDNGKRKYKTFKAKTKKEVQEKLNQYLIDTNNLQIIPKNDNITVGKYIKTYLDVYKSNKIKESSNTRNYGILNNQLKLIADLPVKKLTAKTIQAKLINQLVSDGYSYSTIHKAYTLLNESMNKAVQEHIILINPCTAVEMPTKNIITPKQIEILSDDEIKDFLKAVNTEKLENCYAIALVLYTGLRGGELCALKWSDIDFDNKVITVQRDVSVSKDSQGKRVVKLQEGTKTKLKRIVPLNPESIDLLNKIKAYNPESDRLVKSKAEVMQVSTIGQQYDRILKYAGINGKTGIHTLRHTYASILIKKGVDIKIVSEILGHSSVNFTYNTYVHLTQDQKLSAVQNLTFNFDDNTTE